ncbi:MAG TPA: hypothetical protein VGS80_07640 [Ktedonobacterales bacterium]|jgi:hypothetical protein|nr:hypothetical protein [Ktedonobacterales bacterium]
MPYRKSDPFSPPDPQYLIQAYGLRQLDRALQDYMLDTLKQTADRIQASHPGSKPKSRASKQSVIDYIVQYSGTSD